MNNSQNNSLIPGCTHEAEPGRMHGAEHQPDLPLYKNAPKAGTPEASTISSSEPVLPATGWAVKLQHFPAELKDKPIWCVWRYLVREAKPTKVPMQIDGRMAKSNDPQTWATFADACATADGDGELGVGVFCDGSFTFIDLDHCRDAETGAVEPWATRILNRVISFRELSPSSTGFHIFADGTIATAVKKNGVEMYSRGRFATVTGDGAFGEFMPCRELEQIRTEVADGKLGKGTGIIARTRKGLSLEQLEAGESPNDDRSEGDYQYVALLAEDGLTDEEIDARFRASDRMRDKWDRNAGAGQSYGERTIAKVRATQAAEEGKGNVDPDDWRPLFHTRAETLNAPPITFAIDGFLQEAGITMLGGLSGHGKTFVALSMVKALLTGEKFLNFFHVPRQSDRVIYLIPESALSPFAARLKLFGLVDFVDVKLFYRTLSADGDISITDPRILRAAEGADVFLDTAVRFMEGDENNAAEQKLFAKNLFALLRAGARTVTGLHHSPKYFEKSDYVSLENVLRGSGDIGAMLATCWGIVQTNKETNELWVENTKPRDFKPCDPFIIQGRPYIDQTGDFRMVSPPGCAGTLNEVKGRNGHKVGGRPEHPQKAELMPRILEMHGKSFSFDAISLALKREGETAVQISSKTLSRWVREHKAAQELDKPPQPPKKPNGRAAA